MVLGPYSTNYRIWMFAAVCGFVALGLVDPVAGVAKGENSFWAYVGILLRRDYFCSTQDILAVITIRALVQALPAVVFGWVFQAFFVVLWSIIRGNAESGGVASSYQTSSVE